MSRGRSNDLLHLQQFTDNFLQELEHYLHHVRDRWADITRCAQDVVSLVDFRSVQLLQTRSPSVSEVDKNFIVESMNKRVLFPLVSEGSSRTQLLQNILGIDCMIPSLFTFFEDTKWLEPAAKIIRGLLPPGKKGSIRQQMFKKFTGRGQAAGQFHVEHGNLQLMPHKGDENQAVCAAYCQLWLFAWRHFPEMIAITPRKDSNSVKPRPQTPNSQLWQRLAHLALALGFESEELEDLKRQESDAVMAQEFLLQARPVQYFTLQDSKRAELVRDICRILNCVAEFPGGERLRPRQDTEVPVEHRYGRPYEASHNQSKRFFFLPDVYGAQDHGLSVFSVNRDIFLAFFGRTFGQQVLDQVLVDFSMPDIIPTGKSTLKPSGSQQQSYDFQSSGDFTFESGGKTPTTNSGFNNARPLEKFGFTHSRGIIKASRRKHRSEINNRPSDPLETILEGQDTIVNQRPDSSNNMQTVDSDGAANLFDDEHDQEDEDAGTEHRFEIDERPNDRSNPFSEDQDNDVSQTLDSSNNAQNVDHGMADDCLKNEDQQAVPNVQSEPIFKELGLKWKSDPDDPLHVFPFKTCFKAWETCPNGYTVLLSTFHETIDTYGPQHRQKLKEDLASSANGYFFAVYDPKSKTVKSIAVDNVHAQTKGDEQDGVVFVLKRVGIPEEDARMDNIRGETTEERMESLQRFYARKRKKVQDSHHDRRKRTQMPQKSKFTKVSRPRAQNGAESALWRKEEGTDATSAHAQEEEIRRKKEGTDALSAHAQEEEL